MRTSLDAGTREPDRGLRPWFRIWHPRYRKLLLLLLAMAAAASCLDYGQNLALEALTRALGTTLARGEPDASQGLIGELGVRLGLTVPLLLLLSYFLISTLRLAVSYWNEHYTGRLDVESRSDLEQQMLLHLVRQDEAFFARCSPGEIVNRIGVDLGRALDRRTQVTGACWSAALLASNLAFFLARGWVLAAVALGACVAGTLLARRITRPIHELDRLHLEADDGVKATFEDLLGAAEEIRATNLFEPLGRAFGARLQARADIYRRYVRLNALLNLSQRGAAVLTVATMVLVAMSLGPEGAPASGLALIPVIIHVLPRLLANSADLVVHRLRLAMGTTSIERLLEYEAAMPPHAATQRGRGAEPDAPPLAPVPLAVAGATFRYTSADGALVGGISNVSVDIAPTGWLGLIGGAGSGKSTLLKLLIGQAAPQQGTVRIGDAPAHALSPEARARTFAYMPQRPTILDATIVENLLFGRGLMGAADGERLLSAADVALVERSGLGRVCRTKALDLEPDRADAARALGQPMATVRASVRERLKSRGWGLAPLEETGRALGQTIAERLVAGAADRGVLHAHILARGGQRRLAKAAETELGTRLCEVARRVIRESSGLLALADFAAFSRLARFPLAAEVWELRRALRSGAEEPTAHLGIRTDLLRVGLSCNTEEAQATVGDELDACWRLAARSRDGALQRWLATLVTPFRLDELHPHLDWRANLAFAEVSPPNRHVADELDTALLEAIDDLGLAEAFTRIGLRYPVGRRGGQLSGGQRQLIALCRTLLLDTPVVAFDEPTSALDPASRSRVAALLRELAARRLVVTISHDPDLFRHADRLLVMEAGGLAAAGTFEELRASSNAFGRVLGS